MSSHRAQCAAPRENIDATRAAVVSLCARILAPLFRDGELRPRLAGWLAPLPADRIVKAIHGSAEGTADALADAILASSSASDPADAIADIVADEYRSASADTRTRLTSLAQTIRTLATDQDGSVSEFDLAGRGFGLDEQKRLIAKATHVLAILEGRVQPSKRGGARCASDRLIEAGERARARLVPASALAV